MELTEIQLRKLVERVMELTLEMAGRTAKKEVLVVLSGYNAPKFYELLKTLKVNDKYKITVVVTKEQMDYEEVGKTVCEFADKIVTPKEVLSIPLKYESIIFPAMPRDVLAKCALCIPDTYEVMIVQRAIEEEVLVQIANKAFSKFTGREPKSYQDKILGYIRTLIEFGIEIQVDFDTEKR